MYKNIYELIKVEENKYKTQPVKLDDQWEWSMYEHVRKSFLYKHSRHYKGNPNDGKRPYRNIIYPVLNVGYRSEGFDVKDVFLHSDKYHLSLIARKYHEKYARENHIDTFIDDFVESYVDYGLALSREPTKSNAPSIVNLRSLSFCNQADVLASPIGIEHFYTLSELQQKADGGVWDKDKVDELTSQLYAQGKSDCKIYEVYGMFPNSFLNEGATGFSYQMHLVSFYTTSEGDVGVTLFAGKKKNPFKAFKRGTFYGRACGWGGIEELFEPQMWMNYSEIRMKEMLDAAAVSVWVTADKNFAQRNKVNNLSANEILYAEGGISNVSPNVSNIEKFRTSAMEWENHARVIGSANEAVLGTNPTSGTPFKLQELIVGENKGLHEYRQGQIASFFAEEIYPDWILPTLVQEINKGTDFLSELSLDELREVRIRILDAMTAAKVKKALLDGKDITQEEIDQMKELEIASMERKGNRARMQIMQGELDGIKFDIEINIAGKQKRLAQDVDKLVNIFRQVLSAPDALQDPGMANLFNQIIEASGFSPVSFMQLTSKREAEKVAEEPSAVAISPNTLKEIA